MKKSRKQSTSKSANSRTIMKDNILKVLENSKKPLSTDEIAQILNRSWHTIIRYCLDLENESQILKFEIGRISAWQIKK
jgi:response regulator of citrate/malate metabolism